MSVYCEFSAVSIVNGEQCKGAILVYFQSLNFSLLVVQILCEREKVIGGNNMNLTRV